MREFVFYFGHRLIHARFLYRYIHAVHHRNTDIEPFAGMCMHRKLSTIFVLLCCVMNVGGRLID
jgi:sterol desaturase/sphingolipid hydroxylase (fatty acid hydroxylase superfamily)